MICAVLMFTVSFLLADLCTIDLFWEGHDVLDAAVSRRTMVEGMVLFLFACCNPIHKWSSLLVENVETPKYFFKTLGTGGLC